MEPQQSVKGGEPVKLPKGGGGAPDLTSTFPNWPPVRNPGLESGDNRLIRAGMTALRTVAGLNAEGTLGQLQGTARRVTGFVSDTNDAVRLDAVRTVGAYGARFLREEQATPNAEITRARHFMLAQLATQAAAERNPEILTALRTAANGMATDTEKAALRRANPELAARLFGPAPKR